MAKVAVLVANGFEDSELAVPVERLVDAGHGVILVGREAEEELTGVKGRVRVTTDSAVRDHRPDEFDLLFIPGGKSPAALREDPDVVAFVEGFCRIGRPVAAICHGPQLLIAARQGAGRRMTGWPSVQEELREFGAIAVDEPVVEDGAYLTSRGPDDLDVFIPALLHRAHLRQEIDHKEVRTG